MKFSIILVYINIAIYATCFHMINPILIEIVEKLSEGKSHYGYVKSLFSLIQSIGGLFMGPITDKYGSKIAMLLSIGGSVAYYSLLYNASTITTLYISNIPTFFQHMFLATQKFLTDNVKKEERAKFNGFLAVSYGIGLLVGPKLGGYIGKENPQLTTTVSTGLSIVSFIATLIFLKQEKKQQQQTPENSEQVKQEEGKDNKNQNSQQQEKQQNSKFQRMFKNKDTKNILVTKGFTAMGNSFYYSMMNVFLKDIFQLDPSQRGGVLSTFGLVGSLTSGLLTPFLNKRKIAGKKAIMAGQVLAVLGYLILIMAHEQYYILLIGGVPLSMGLSLFQNFQSAELTNSVADEDTGSILSLDMALGSAYRVVAPTAGSFILNTYGYQALMGTCLSFVTVALIFSTAINQKKKEKKE